MRPAACCYTWHIIPGNPPPQNVGTVAYKCGYTSYLNPICLHLQYKTQLIFRLVMSLLETSNSSSRTSCRGGWRFMAPTACRRALKTANYFTSATVLFVYGAKNEVSRCQKCENEGTPGVPKGPPLQPFLGPKKVFGPYVPLEDQNMVKFA